MKHKVNESEVSEMGLKIDKLKELQPKNYLIKSLKEKEKNQRVKSNIELLNQKYNEIRSSISSLSWRDLILKPDNQDTFYVGFPKHILKQFTEFKKLYDKIEKDGGEVDGKYKLLSNHYDYIMSNGLINMYIEKKRNRTHFPGGLPSYLLGLNLGYKFYRKLVDYLGYIQSSETATKEVQNIYRNLMEQSDLNCVLTKDNILIMKKDLSKEEKIKYSSEFIFEKYYEERKKTPFVLGKNIIFDKQLERDLNPNKITTLLIELFNFYMSNKREPFKGRLFTYGS